MKLTRKQIPASFLALVATVLLAASGCNSSLSPISGQKALLPLLSQVAPGTFLSRYDTSNLTGLLVARKELFSIVSHSTHTNWDGTWSWGQAQFADHYGNPLNIGTVIFNKQYANNAAGSGATGNYYYSGNDLPFFTDGSTLNQVMVLAIDSSNGRGIDSLTFSGMPSITNVVRGQNISRDSDITINWTGTSSDFAYVGIVTWDTTGTNDTIGRSNAIGAYFDNTGSATLHFNKDQLRKGRADLELIKYEPKFITLSNGKRVAVIGETCEELTVNIVD